MTARGLAKLIEECGELVQVCGKKLACYQSDAHWDGTDLKDRMECEMGDVYAAIMLVTDKLGLDSSHIASQAHRKLTLFREWDADPDNNLNGVDGP